MKNCKLCKRWRPVTDFNYVVYRRGQYGETLYIRHVCRSCERKAQAASSRARRDDSYREKQRLVAETKRRLEDIKPRPTTGLKQRASQDRESKRKARRNLGVPVRPICKRNGGYYGGQKLK